MWNELRRQIRQLLYDDDAWNSFGWLEENCFMQPNTMVGQLSEDAEALIVCHFLGDIPEVVLGTSLSHELVEQYNNTREVLSTIMQAAELAGMIGWDGNNPDPRDPIAIGLGMLKRWYMYEADLIGEDDLALAWAISNKFGVNFERDADMRKKYRLQHNSDEKQGRNHSGDDSSEMDPDDGDLPWDMLEFKKVDKVGNFAIQSGQFIKGTLLHDAGLGTGKLKNDWAFPFGTLATIVSKLLHQIYEREPEMVNSQCSWFRIPCYDGVPAWDLHKPTERGLIKVSKVITSNKGEDGMFLDVPWPVIRVLWCLHGPEDVQQAWDLVRGLSRHGLNGLLSRFKDWNSEGSLFAEICELLWRMDNNDMPGTATHVPVGHKAVPVRTIKVAAFGGMLVWTKMPQIYEAGNKKGPLSKAHTNEITELVKD